MQLVLIYPSADANMLLYNLKAKLSCSECAIKPTAVSPASFLITSGKPSLPDSPQDPKTKHLV